MTHFVREGAIRPKEYTLYPQQNSGKQHLKGKSKDSDPNADPMHNHEAVIATALSKCVFKQGRRTISPSYMLKQSDLLPAKSLDEALPKHELEPMTLDSCSSSDSGIEIVHDKNLSDLEKLERERRRGMRAAASLSAPGQTALDMEFKPDGPALGRHHDGTGCTGCVGTLLQLAHLRTKQEL